MLEQLRARLVRQGPSLLRIPLLREKAREVLRRSGVDLGQVVIGHSGDTTDVDYLCRVADAGSYLGMDRFGLDVLLPFEDRIATVLELLRRGYAERMVLAHDASCFIDWFDRGEVEIVRDAAAQGDQPRLIKSGNVLPVDQHPAGAGTHCAGDDLAENPFA